MAVFWILAGKSADLTGFLNPVCQRIAVQMQCGGRVCRTALALQICFKRREEIRLMRLIKFF